QHMNFLQQQFNATDRQQSPQRAVMAVAHGNDQDNDAANLSDDDNNSLDEEAVLVWRPANPRQELLDGQEHGREPAAVGGAAGPVRNAVAARANNAMGGPAAAAGAAAAGALLANQQGPVTEAMGDFIDIDVNGAEDEDNEDDNAGAAGGAGVVELVSRHGNNVTGHDAAALGSADAEIDEHVDTSDENDNVGGLGDALGYDRYSAEPLTMAMALSAAAAANAAAVAAAAASAAAANAASATATTSSDFPATAAPTANIWQGLDYLNDLSSGGGGGGSSTTAPSAANDTGAAATVAAGINNLSAATAPKQPRQHEQQQQQQRFSSRRKEAADTSRSQYWLWSPTEAQHVELQLLGSGGASGVGKLGPSSCGPAALICAMKALGIDVDPVELSAAVPASLRVHNAGLTAYLLSRARAGTTAQDLIDGVQRFTNGRVRARFFACHPRRKLPGRNGLHRWLSDWMRRGAVAILTLNPQVIGGAAVSTGAASPSADAAAATTAAGAGGGNGSRVVADAWHHQMVYGVTHEGVHLTNPHSLLTWPSLSAQLCSESVLLVRKADVCKVWTNNDDLTPLANQPDPRWTSMNVLGQVICTLREFKHKGFDGFRPKWAHHVCLPAAYKSGISLFATDPAVCRQLAEADELPLARPSDEDSCDDADEDGEFQRAAEGAWGVAF
ncbi:hypothetical protein BOX15_Mlig032702g2, partial [Macrostomum lignano]